MTTNSQLSTTEPKEETKKLNKQLEQEQNHRNGDHMEGYQQGSGRGGEEGKVERISSINGRCAGWSGVKRENGTTVIA